MFFVGRGIDYAVCLEGSLKLKEEISYIHSEAYAAGELKHGTISLIEQGTLVIGVLTQSELYENTISNMLECKSRGAYLIGLTTYGKYETEDQVNFTVYQTLPKPFRAEDTQHRPYHTALCGRSAFCGEHLRLLHQHKPSGKLQLRNRYGWAGIALCRGKEPQLVFVQQCQ